VDFYLTWHTSSLTNNQNLAHFFEKTLAIPKNKKTWHRKPGTSGNWGSGISPSIRGDTVFKWTHQLQKEADSLERSLHCARGGWYPRLPGEGSHLIKKVSVMERLPWRVSTIEHR